MLYAGRPRSARNSYSLICIDYFLMQRVPMERSQGVEQDAIFRSLMQFNARKLRAVEKSSRGTQGGGADSVLPPEKCRRLQNGDT